MHQIWLFRVIPNLLYNTVLAVLTIYSLNARAVAHVRAICAVAGRVLTDELPPESEAPSLAWRVARLQDHAVEVPPAGDERRRCRAAAHAWCESVDMAAVGAATGAPPKKRRVLLTALTRAAPAERRARALRSRCSR